MKQKLLLFLSLLFSNYQLNAQNKTQTYAWDNEKYPRERLIDMDRMIVDVSFNPQEGIVFGQVSHYFKPLRERIDSVFFDAPGITIKSVFVNGKPTDFKTNNEGVSIYPTKPLVWDTYDSIRIVYQAQPKKGIYFIGWNDKNNISRKQIWTQGQGVDNRYWIPMWDDVNDKMLTETVVRIDKKYNVLSNGTKVREFLNKDGTKTWHYRMNRPHAGYLIMLGIGEYKIKETKSKSGVPIRLYYYPDQEDRVDYTYKHTVDIMNFFEEEIGVPFPWESYSQIPVQDFMYGAMENTTATLFGDFFCADKRSYRDRNYVGVDAHEMAHQWFGDMVTARCEPHHWLQESFATHYNMMAEGVIFGTDHFDWARRNAQNSALEADSKDLYPVASSKAGSARYYPKGAIVLNMLKYVVGTKTFNRAIKYYLLKHAYKNVDSNDLLVAFEEATGYSLGWFWEEWLYKAGEPEYKVNFFNAVNNAKQAEHHFIVEQTQDINDYTGLFKMPVVFEIYYTDGTKQSKTIWIENTIHDVVIPNSDNKTVDYVLFDPNAEIAKKIYFHKSNEMLLSQATKARNMIDRYDAWVQLRAADISLKRNALIESFNKEKHYSIKTEILNQLLYDSSLESKKIVKSVFYCDDTDLKKGLIQSMAIIPIEFKPDYEKLLQDSSYDIIALSLEKLCTQFADHASEYLEKTKGIIGVRNRNVELKWLEMNLSLKGNQQMFNTLVAYTSNSYEFQTRIAAMNVLKKFNYFDVNLMDNCFDAIFNPNTRLSGPAGDILRYYRAQFNFRDLINNKIAELRNNPYQDEIINKHFK